MKQFVFVRILIYALTMVTVPKHGSAQSTLSIIHPADGATINAGQTIEADVEGVFDTVILGCDLPLQCIRIETSSRGSRWSITVPSDILPGQYFLQASASGLKDHTSPVLSNRVGISVAITSLPGSLAFSPSAGAFDYIGDQRHFSLLAAMTNGSTFDISKAPQTVISTSTNVKRTGNMYTALAPGNAKVVATIAIGGASVSATLDLTIPHSIAGDFNSDGKVDTDDLNILLGFKNRPANGPNDGRDLNHDGKIDALDARILTTLCTYPRCATHP